MLPVLSWDGQGCQAELTQNKLNHYIACVIFYKPLDAFWLNCFKNLARSVGFLIYSLLNFLLQLPQSELFLLSHWIMKLCFLFWLSLRQAALSLTQFFGLVIVLFCTFVFSTFVSLQSCYKLKHCLSLFWAQQTQITPYEALCFGFGANLSYYYSVWLKSVL